MNKPLSLPEGEPRKVQRADRVPSEGFSLVVDSHFKKQYADEESAKIAGAELLSRYPMLQIEIYDGERGRERSFPDSAPESCAPTAKKQLDASGLSCIYK